MTTKELKYALVSGAPIVIEQGYVATEGTVIGAVVQMERGTIVLRAEVKTTLGGRIDRFTLNRLKFKDSADVETLVNLCARNITQIHF